MAWQAALLVAVVTVIGNYVFNFINTLKKTRTEKLEEIIRNAAKGKRLAYELIGRINDFERQNVPKTYLLDELEKVEETTDRFSQINESVDLVEALSFVHFPKLTKDATVFATNVRVAHVRYVYPQEEMSVNDYYNDFAEATKIEAMVTNHPLFPLNQLWREYAATRANRRLD